MKKFVWIGGSLILFIASICAPSDLKNNNKAFDAQVWKTGDARTRGQMVRSLLDQKELLNQKSIAEVVEMLGEPNKRGESFASYHVKYGFLIEELLPSRMYLFAEFDKTSGTFTRLSMADA